MKICRGVLSEPRQSSEGDSWPIGGGWAARCLSIIDGNINPRRQNRRGSGRRRHSTAYEPGVTGFGGRPHGVSLGRVAVRGASVLRVMAEVLNKNLSTI